MQALQHRIATAKSLPWPSNILRVALVITDLDVGGAERAIVNLATRIDRRRWQAKVFALAGEGSLAKVLRAEGIAYQCLGCTRSQPVRVVTRLRRALRAYQPQIVQSFLFHANLASRLAAAWPGGPWVLGGLRVAEHRKRWHLAFDRLTARLSAGSVCVSHGVLEFSQKVGGLDPDRLTVIPNGIDPAPFDAAKSLPRRDLGIPDDAHLVLYVGRLDPQKGLSHLLDAAGQMILQSPTWHLALVGDGPCRTWLTQRIGGDARLTERIHWLGPRDDVPRLLKSSDVLVLPSLWEGMPNVILEAMAASKPVVATSVEGTRELVIPGETGWLVPPGSTPGLTAALLSAALNPEQCKAYGLKGRERVVSRFSLDETVAAYDRLWTRLLGYQVD